jgi:hypothetical protein
MLRAFRQKVAKPGKIGKKWQNQLKVVKSTKSKVFHQTTNNLQLTTNNKPLPEILPRWFGYTAG